MREPRPDGAVDGLADVFASLVELGGALAEVEFELPTECPGWTVKDQFSHVIGTELLLGGAGAPPAEARRPAHVRNGLGALNERFVAARRGRPGADVVAELAALSGGRVASLRALADEAADAGASAGLVPYVDYATVRMVDAWVHEQDVRRATGRPGGRGGAGERGALDRLEACMPHVLSSRVAAPIGTTVRLDVVGPLGRTIQLCVVPGEHGPTRAVAAPVLEGPPRAAVRLGQETFARRACGRVSADAARRAPGTETAGDAGLVAAFLSAMVVVA